MKVLNYEYEHRRLNRLPPFTQAEIIFDAADANRDKTLDEKEFNAALKLAPSAVPDGPDRQGRIQAARAKFRQLDKDNSHFITKEEVTYPHSAHRFLEGVLAAVFFVCPSFPVLKSRGGALGQVMIHPNAFTTFLRSPGEAPEGDSHQVKWQ